MSDWHLMKKIRTLHAEAEHLMAQVRKRFRRGEITQEVVEQCEKNLSNQVSQQEAQLRAESAEEEKEQYLKETHKKCVNYQMLGTGVPSVDLEMGNRFGTLPRVAARRLSKKSQYEV